MADNFLETSGFYLKKFLGRGGMSTVGLYEKIEEDGSILKKAIKIMKLDSPNIRSYQREAIINNYISTQLTACKENGNFILNYEGIHHEGKIYFFSDDLDTDLRLFIREKNIPLPVTIGIICQLIHALDCLHTIGVIHGDLKSSNIFINKNTGFVKIADFGGSGIEAGYFNHKKMPVTVTTKIFLPPLLARYRDLELIDDVWYLALIFLEILDIRAFRIIREILDNLKRPPGKPLKLYIAVDLENTIQEVLQTIQVEDVEFGKNMISLLISMFKVNSLDRIHIKEIMQLEWISETCSSLLESVLSQNSTSSRTFETTISPTHVLMKPNIRNSTWSLDEIKEINESFIQI